MHALAPLPKGRCCTRLLFFIQEGLIMPGHTPAKDEAPFPGSDGRSWQQGGKLLSNEMSKLLVGEHIPVAILPLKHQRPSPPEPLRKGGITDCPHYPRDTDFSLFAFVEPFPEVSADGPIGAGLRPCYGRERFSAVYVGLTTGDWCEGDNGSTLSGFATVQHTSNSFCA